MCAFWSLFRQTFPRQQNSRPATSAATLACQRINGQALPWTIPKAIPMANPIIPPNIIKDFIINLHFFQQVFGQSTTFRWCGE